MSSKTETRIKERERLLKKLKKKAEEFEEIKGKYKEFEDEIRRTKQEILAIEEVLAS